MKYKILKVENPNYLYLKIDNNIDKFKKYISDKVTAFCHKIFRDYKLEENFLDFPANIILQDKLANLNKQNIVAINTSFIGGLLSLGMILRDGDIDCDAHRKELTQIYKKDLAIFNAIHSTDDIFKETTLLSWIDIEVLSLNKLCHRKMQTHILLFQPSMSRLPQELKTRFVFPQTETNDNENYHPEKKSTP